MSLRSEIREQPDVLARLVGTQRLPVRAMARTIRHRGVHSIFLAARGTSDNAGLYAKYLWGSMNGLPVALAAPSLFTIYGTPPSIKGSLVVGISQSGQSPDIVSVLAEGRRQGALGLAITNEVDSPLAQEADLVLHTAAGSEISIAATKTYTTQLMAIALLSAALRDDDELFGTLEDLPELIGQTLAREAAIERAAQRYRSMSQCVVIGRGFNYATAFEWSLKLKELAYVVAEPYSSADFQHGPIAIVSDGFPVLAAVPRGKVSGEIASMIARLARERQAELVVISNDPAILEGAATAFPLPESLPEWISPLVSIVPAQLFCYHLTRAKGFDTERPRGLNKVTRTW